MNPERINFILGTPFCGSTIFAGILSTGDGVFNCGEIDRIDGVGDNEHPYVDGEYCLYCAPYKKACSVFTDSFMNRVISKSSSPYEIYREFSASFKSPILLDGSKHAYWLRNAARDDRVREISRAIILVRKPTSFCKSFICSDESFLKTPWIAPELWRDTYVDIMRTVFHYGIPFTIVRYEDLGVRFEEIINISAEWFGIDHVDTSGSYCFSDLHVLGGNQNVSDRVAKKEDKIDFKVKLEVPDKAMTDLVMMTPGLIDLAVNLFGYSDI